MARPKGVDVYAGDGVIDHARVRRAGYDFAIVKATQGHWLNDPKWSPNVIGFRNAGALVGSYHFLEATWDGTAQAKWFLRKVGGHKNLIGQLHPVLDAERRGGMDKTQYTDTILAFSHVIEVEVGVKPILYMDRNYCRNMVESERLRDHKLWLAAWQKSWPVGPWGEFTDEDVVLWQNDAFATVPGMPNVGGVDVDQCRLTIAQMKRSLTVK